MMIAKLEMDPMGMGGWGLYSSLGRGLIPWGWRIEAEVVLSPREREAER